MRFRCTSVDGCTIFFKKDSVKLLLADFSDISGETHALVIPMHVIAPNGVNTEHVFCGLEADLEPWAFIVSVLDELDALEWPLSEFLGNNYAKKAVESAVLEIVRQIREAVWHFSQQKA